MNAAHRPGGPLAVALLGGSLLLPAAAQAQDPTTPGCAMGDGAHAVGYVIRIGGSAHACTADHVWEEIGGLARANCVYDDSTYGEGAEILVGRGNYIVCTNAGAWEPAEPRGAAGESAGGSRGGPNRPPGRRSRQ